MPNEPDQPNLSSALSPGPILAISGAYWRSCALHAAVKLDVFSPLAQGPATARELAPLLGANARALDMLLTAMCGLGLLTRHGDGFALTELSRAFLVQSSPRYVGHIILHHHHLVDSFGRMDESVRSGGPNRASVQWSEEEREAFLLGMFNIASGIAPRLAPRLDALLEAAELPGVLGQEEGAHILDLGGGPGTYALHFCLAHPEVSAVIYDLPTTRPFAEATAARLGVPFGPQGRVDFHAGDYTLDPLPGGFDLVWLSQILHAEDPATAAAVVRKAAGALRPGGVLVAHEFLLHDSCDGPEFPALFALNMLMGTPGGQAYSAAQLRAMLEAAGLSGAVRLGFTGPNDSGLVAAVKAQA